MRKFFPSYITGELALFLHNFRAIVERAEVPKRYIVVFIDKTTIFFLIYFLIDILFLFYCIWLITGDSWEPGCMLLFLSALESYGVQGRIAGAYEVSPQGFIYAKIWFKYLMSAANNVHPSAAVPRKYVVRRTAHLFLQK